MARRLALPGEVQDQTVMGLFRYLADNAAHWLLDTASGKPRPGSGTPGEMVYRRVDGEDRLYVRTNDGWRHAVLKED